MLTAGRASGYALSFLRNLILARLLTKADYGLAALFAVTMSLLEVRGRMAFGQQIIQSKFGNDPSFMASAHALQFFAGLCSSILIVFAAVPLSEIFGAPDAWWAFASLSVVPLLQGMSHLDVSRRQRELEFRPLIWIDVIPQTVVTALAWPLTVLIGDFRVIVILIIAKGCLGCGLSFAFAQRPYRWGWRSDFIRSMISFGWPLLLTGLLVFGSQQGDQMLIGAKFSLEELASYALAVMLVLMPWHIVAQAAGSLILPVFARSQEDKEGLRKSYRVASQAFATIGILCMTPLIIGGEMIIRLLYGSNYVGTGLLLSLLGAAMALRYLRLAATCASVAVGDTLTLLYANILRAIGLPLAVVVMSLGGGPPGIAACAIISEAIAMVYCVARFSRRQGFSFKESRPAIGYMIVFLAPAVAFSLLFAHRADLLVILGVLIVWMLSSIAAAWAFFPDLAALGGSLVHGKWRRLPGVKRLLSSREDSSL